MTNYNQILWHGPKIRSKITVALSGGVDSVAALDYIANGKYDVDAVFVDHRTETSAIARPLVEQMADNYNIRLHISELSDPPSDKSHELWWREQRYEIFKTFHNPVVTCHHLDDCVETWIWTFCRTGHPRIIPYRHDNVIRPFRLCKKDAFYAWARRKNLVWAEDASNNDCKYTRNYIRHEIVDRLKIVNPGIDKMVRKMILQEDNENV